MQSFFLWAFAPWEAFATDPPAFSAFASPLFSGAQKFQELSKIQMAELSVTLSAGPKQALV